VLLLFAVLSSTSRSFSVVSLHALLYPLTDLFAAVAAGLGFAFAHISIVFAAVFLYASEMGALFTDSCSLFSVFSLSAWNAFFFGLLHIALMLLQLDAVRRQERRKMSTPIALHILAAVAMIIGSNNCIVSLFLLLCVTAAAIALTAVTLLQPDYASRKRP
jgi:hypothetical protein